MKFDFSSEGVSVICNFVIITSADGTSKTQL